MPPSPSLEKAHLLKSQSLRVLLLVLIVFLIPESDFIFLSSKNFLPSWLLDFSPLQLPRIPLKLDCLVNFQGSKQRPWPGRPEWEPVNCLLEVISHSDSIYRFERPGEYYVKSFTLQLFMSQKHPGVLGFECNFLR